MDYDAQANRILAVVSANNGGTPEVWAYAADKNAWSEVKFAGSGPHGIFMWNLLAYDPEHKCHLFLNVPGVSGDTTDGLYAFRLKP